MLCPKCEGTELEAVQMQRDLEIDRCPKCDGVWLDRSEVYAFVDRPNQAYEEFKALVQGMAPTSFECPRCGQPMLQVRIEAAGLPFEACARCGGNWFDKGEVQKLCAYLDERWAAANRPGAPGRPAAEPRVPTQAELASWLGPDGAFSWFSPRRWYIQGCQVVEGEIGHYADEIAEEAEVRVLFDYGGMPYQVTRIIRHGSPLDVGAGGRVLVLVNSLYPRGAVIAAPVRGGAWSDGDRREGLSPQSLAPAGGLRGGVPGTSLFLRLGCLALVVLGVQELLSGEAVHHEWHRYRHTGDVALLLGGYYQRYELHGDLARLHGFAQAAGGLLVLILDLLGLTRFLPAALLDWSRRPRCRPWYRPWTRRW